MARNPHQMPSFTMALTSPAATGAGLYIDPASGWDPLRSIDGRVEVPMGEDSDSDFYDDEDDSDSLYEPPRIEIGPPFWDNEYDSPAESSELSDPQVDFHGMQLRGNDYQESEDHKQGLLSRLQAALRLSSFKLKFKGTFPALFRWLSTKFASSRSLATQVLRLSTVTVGRE